ncbi:hypothetical protein B296_00000873 [Ensete ventricosum]|uniref:Uncharacterized protein n=1 Tax=Ensete ventricosum TaxID=4639 RepID=A0A426ZGN1_ENSVE|nr:hypothetical protein B296_00000873 [Ensete ventricosum]
MPKCTELYRHTRRHIDRRLREVCWKRKIQCRRRAGNAAMEVPLLVEADAAAVEHEEDCLVQDSSLMRRGRTRQPEVGGGTILRRRPLQQGNKRQLVQDARTTGRER